MPFRESIKMFLNKHMTLFHEKVKAVFTIRNTDIVVTPQVDPQHSADFGNNQSFDEGLSRQLPGSLIIGGIAQEKDLDNFVTNPLNDKGIAQYFDSVLMAQFPHRFATGRVSIQGIEQSDNQVTDAGENETIEGESNLILDGADNQDINTAETQVLDRDENVSLQNLEPTVSFDVGNCGYQALGCARSSRFSGSSSWNHGQNVIEVRRLLYHPYQTGSRSLAIDGKSNYSLADSEDSISDLSSKPSQYSEILGVREHSTASVASIAVITQHSTASASTSPRSGDHISLCSQRDPSSETTLLPQDSVTTMPNNTSSSSNTANHVNSSEVTIQDAGSDTAIGSSSSTANSDKFRNPAKAKIDDCVSRSMQSFVEELRQHYLNGHLNSPEPYSSIRGNHFMGEFRRRENGETPIGYFVQDDTMGEFNGKATADATEEKPT